jgi:hypothetical protein
MSELAFLLGWLDQPITEVFPSFGCNTPPRRVPAPHQAAVLRGAAGKAACPRLERERIRYHRSSFREIEAGGKIRSVSMEEVITPLPRLEY